MSAVEVAAAGAEVLVIEDDAGFREVLVRAIERHGYRATEAASVAAARRLLQKRSFDCALIDVHLGDGSGLDVIEPLRESAGVAPFVIMSALPDAELVARAKKLGAIDFVEKPVDPSRLLLLVENAVEKARLVRENAALKQRLGAAAPAIPLERFGPAMQEVFAQARRVAATDVPVLIRGESGTGKEVVARAIHDASPRAKGPWVPVNCGALRPELIDSELYGHEKGSFTGAVDRRPGLVEVARDGTLLLDEVAELPASAQVSLLRFLENREYRRVGGTAILTSNARVIAATHRELEKMAAAGQFREDLLFRLDVVTIRIPPLRERPEDVPVYVEHFLRLRGVAEPLAPAVVASLQRREWRGNVRELRNAVDRLLLGGGVGAPQPAEPREPPVEKKLWEVERDHILRVLNAQGWHQGNAARALGISTRTLYRKIRLYELEPR